MRLLRQLQESGAAEIQFRQSGMKGGFWGALAAGLLPMALPLVEKGVGALVKKISGGGHGPVPITCTKCQMDKIKQCGAGLRVNFKVSKKGLGKNPSLAVKNAVQGLHGAGFMSSIIPMVLRVARPVGRAIGNAAVSVAKHLVRKGAEKVGERVGQWGSDLFVRKLSGQEPLDLSLFPNVPTGEPHSGPVHGLFPPPPQSGKGLRLSGKGVRLAGRAQSGAALNYPRRFVIKRP